MTVPSVQKIENLGIDADAFSDLVNTKGYVNTRLGGAVASFPLVLSRIAHGNITTYSTSATYQEYTDWVEFGGVVYRPRPAMLPIGPEPFNASKWVVVQDNLGARGSSVTVFNNIVDLKDGFDAEGAIVDMERLAATNAIVKTKEYHQGSGRGGAEYTVMTLAQARSELGVEWYPDEFGDHLIAGSPSYVALIRLPESGDLNPLHFGAVGDGVADDSEPTLALQAWNNFHGIHKLWIGPTNAVYRWTKPVVIGGAGNTRHVIGDTLGSASADGRIPTVLWDGPEDTYAITCESLPHGSLQGFFMRSTTGLNSGMDLLLFRQCKMHDIHLEGFDVGLKTSHFWIADWNSIRIRQCGIGWWHARRPDGRHSDCNGLFAKNIQVLSNDIGILFDERANIRAVEISANIELNRIGVMFNNFQTIENMRIYGYWERSTESDLKIVPGNFGSPVRPKLDLSGSYFFTLPDGDGQTDQIIDAVTDNAEQITEIIMDNCNFSHQPKNGFMRVTGPSSIMRIFGDDCRGVYDGGPNGGPLEGKFEAWKLASKGPDFSTIYVPTVESGEPPFMWFTGPIVRSVSRSGVKSLRGELTVMSNTTTPTARQVWGEASGVFEADFRSPGGHETYWPTKVNGVPSTDLFLRIQTNGDGALVNDNGLGLVAGDIVSFSISEFRPPS